MSKYTDRLRDEYEKLKRSLSNLSLMEPLGLNAYEISLNQWWDRYSEQAKTDEQKQIIDDAKTLIRVTFEKQRSGGNNGQ